MIAQLTGKLVQISPPNIILDVAGVGYELSLPLSHLARLPNLNTELTVFTHLIIREDAHNLYGFLSLEDRAVFRVLIKVSGIGAKIALAILATISNLELIQAINNQDVKTLCLTPGIGKKMAERMLLELQDKFDDYLTINNNPTYNNLTSLKSDGANLSINRDLRNALDSLGYGTREINQVLNQVTETSDLSIAIKQALKLLTPSH